MTKENIFSKELGIDLDSGREEELFKWFLACLLFGKPIQQEVAKRAYMGFISAGVVSPSKIIAAGWDRLVQLLDEGHYVRYDYSTAAKLLEVSSELLKRYRTVKNLINGAENEAELKKKLMDFKGVGPVTTRIFVSNLKDTVFWGRLRRLEKKRPPCLL